MNPIRIWYLAFWLASLGVRRLQGQSELQVRITAHVREKTGHNTLFAFQQNGATEQEKIGLWKECLAAIVNGTVESLQGATAVGQTSRPAEECRPAPKSTPAAKPEGKAERIAESPGPVKSGEIDQLRELLGKILGSRKQEIDETRVWEIAASVTQTAVTNALADFAVTFKAPPRDVVEIRKWDGTVKEIGPIVHRQFKQVMQFVTARNTRGYPLPVWLYGSPGAGKSHLFSEIQTHKNKMKISGNTYPVREQLKALGGKWVADEKAWEVPDANGAQAQALVASAPVSQRRSFSGGQTKRCWECGCSFTYGDAKRNGGDWSDSYCGC